MMSIRSLSLPLTRKTPVAMTLGMIFGLSILSGCASVAPTPLNGQELSVQARSDRQAAQSDVEPIKGSLGLEEAIARGLKYNLERRVRMMEEAIAFNQFDVSQYDMLPKLAASAGYHTRSDYSITKAVDSVTGLPSLANPFISSEKTHTLTDLGLTWNLLDFGLSYYGAKQNADRAMIAVERRRKAMHTLIQDVRTAFWRTASAQKLRDEVKSAIALAEEALIDARKAEAERIRSPLDALRYQRQVLENLRLLETIDQELSTAKVELANLINAPLAVDLNVVEPVENLSKRMLELPVEAMEDVAIARNADLREQFYNTRIAGEETRKTLLRMFPSLSFNYNLKHDTDKYLVHSNWNEAGAQLSFNLLNLLSAPAQFRLADAGVALADQRRVATQMAILAQVHIARLQYANALQQFQRSDAIWVVDDKINRHGANRELAQTQSKLERVANNTAAILSLLRRYQALAQAHAAASKFQATLGMEPELGSVRDMSLAELQSAISAALKRWASGELPVREPAPSVPAAAAATNEATVSPAPTFASEIVASEIDNVERAQPAESAVPMEQAQAYIVGGG